MVKKGLGRGLSALIPEASSQQPTGEQVLLLPLEQIHPNPDQPRRFFDDDALAELAQSIKEQGLLQPLTLRPLAGGSYQIIAGERRYRAAKKAGLKEVPCILRNTGDSETLELALMENIQREDLKPLEEAMSFQALLSSCGYTQETLAKRLGKSRPYIANTIRLLTLPQAGIDALRQGKITAGHGRAVLLLNNSAQQSPMVRKIVEEGWSVRQAEEYAKTQNQLAKGQAKPKAKKKPQAEDLIINDMNGRLSRRFGTKAKVSYQKGGKGSIILEYYSDDDLNRLLELLLPGEQF